MAEIYEVLEIADRSGHPTGRYRMTRRSDESSSPPIGLCEHEHETGEEARKCPAARASLPQELRMDPARRAEALGEGDGRFSAEFEAWWKGFGLDDPSRRLWAGRAWEEVTRRRGARIEELERLAFEHVELPNGDVGRTPWKAGAEAAREGREAAQAASAELVALLDAVWRCPLFPSMPSKLRENINAARARAKKLLGPGHGAEQAAG